MSLLSDATLADLRALQASWLRLRCTVKRPTRTSDGQGGMLAGDTVIGTNVPCRKAVGNGPLERRIADAPRNVQWWVITFEYDRDVRAGDKVEFDTATYKVIGPLSDVENAATALAVAAVRVQ